MVRRPLRPRLGDEPVHRLPHHMLRKAAAMMDGLGASFLVTGEVLGQRPMSQHRRRRTHRAQAGLKDPPALSAL